jgi:hypothetical protein
MFRDMEREAAQERVVSEARRAWIRKRIDNIHSHVTAYDVLRQGGVELYKSEGEEEQFSCPFHGEDRKPSARVYPADGDRPSHAWCFVCREKNWDAIGLWRKFNGGEDKTFGQVLSEIERSYGLSTPDLPLEAVLDTPQVDPNLEVLKTLTQSCENCLRRAKPAYRALGDFKGFVRAGSVLDRVHYRLGKRIISSEKAISLLRELLSKITEKELCLAD